MYYIPMQYLDDKFYDNLFGEENDLDDDKESTSAETRDYSPSNPWDAPGMSIKDFI